MNAKIRREDGKVWLEGGIVVDGSDVNYLEVLQSYIAFEYDELIPDRILRMGSPSEIFSFYFNVDWFDDAATSMKPGDVIGETCAASGYEGKWLANATFEETWARIKECIDSGKAAMCGGIGVGCDEWCVVYGYDDSEATPKAYIAGRPAGLTWVEVPRDWKARTPYRDIAGSGWADRPVFILTGRTKKNHDVRQFLEKAVAVVGEEPGPDMETGRWATGGLAGLRLWARLFEDLTDESARGLVNLEHMPLVCFNLGVANSYVERRRNAFLSLAEFSGRFPQDRDHPACEHIWNAACRYKDAARSMTDFRDALYERRWAESGKCNLVNPEKREKALQFLKEVCTTEDLAVSECERAVALLK